jgi:hypothetical protein
MDSQWLRVRSLLDHYFAVVIVVLVAVAIGAGVGAYAPHFDPGVTTEERTASTWQVNTSFEHNATVVRNNTLFPEGLTLRDRPFYFTTVAPVLNGSYSTQYRTDAAANVSIRTDATLVVQSRTDDGVVLWQDTEPIGTNRVTSATPETPTTLSFSVNVSAINQRIDRIEEQVGTGPGTVQVFVRANTTVDGTVAAEPAAYTTVDRLAIRPEGDAYAVERNATGQQRFVRTTSVLVEKQYGSLRRVGVPILLAVSLVAIGALVVARRRGLLVLTDAEAERLQYYQDREEFEDWITTIQLPEDPSTLAEAEADTLGDLVDIGIDTNNAVIEDPTSGVFYVLGDEFCYYYSPPATASQAAAGDAAVATPADHDDPLPDADAVTETAEKPEPTDAPDGDDD